VALFDLGQVSLTEHGEAGNGWIEEGTFVLVDAHLQNGVHDDWVDFLLQLLVFEVFDVHVREVDLLE